LCEIERGLFHVSYRTDAVAGDLGSLPVYQLGTTAADARQRIEETAQRCGFDTVIWDHPAAAPNGPPAPLGCIASPAPGALTAG
jgi:hypothetical protein